jgi:hypothetical protein
MKKAHDLLEKGWINEIGSDCHRISNIKEQYNREVLTKDIVARLKFD